MNFYPRYIQNFSTIAASLTASLKQQPKKPVWRADTETVFSHVCRWSGCIWDRFGNGTLSVVWWEDQTVPHTLLFQKAYAGREKLWHSKSWAPGRQMALDEWRHWLERALHPFNVFTDRKNLKYLHTAKKAKPISGPLGFVFYAIQFHNLIPSRVEEN